MAPQSGGIGPPPITGRPKGNRPATRRKHQIKGIVGGRAPYKDEAYLNTVSALRNRRNNAQSEIRAQKSSTEIAYGFGMNPLSNPFSRAAMLQKSYDTAQRSTQNQMAAAGHLYSGAVNNARQRNLSGYNQQYDATRKSYEAEMDRLRRAGADAGEDLRMGTVKAAADAQARAKQNRPTAIQSPRKVIAPKKGRR
jgi:hypothetical protein